MSHYSVQLEPNARAEWEGLPHGAFKELHDLLLHLAESPRSGTFPDKLIEDPAFRWAKFDRDLGMAHFRVDDQECVVVVQSVTWVG